MSTEISPNLPTNEANPHFKQPAYSPNFSQQKQDSSRKARFLALTSLIIGIAGILPLLIFSIACIDGFGFGVLMCFIIGLILHSIGAILGFIGIYYGNKKIGVPGLIGNGLIVGACFLMFLLSLAVSRY